MPACVINGILSSRLPWAWHEQLCLLVVFRLFKTYMTLKVLLPFSRPVLPWNLTVSSKDQKSDPDCESMLYVELCCVITL